MQFTERFHIEEIHSVFFLRGRTVFLLFAATAIAAAQTRRPPQPAANTQAAVQLATSGHCSEALPQFQHSPWRTFDLQSRRSVELSGARCAMQLEQPDAAVEFLSALVRDFPNDPEALYLEAHAFGDLSSHASDVLLSSAPNSLQAHELKAEGLADQGKWDDAVAEYRRALQINPRETGMHYQIGRLLLSKPRTSIYVGEAQREMEQELTVDPNNAGAEFALGDLARQASQWPQAIEHFGRATRIDPNFADAFAGLGGALLASGRGGEAIAPLETAARMEPDNPEVHHQLAVAYGGAGRTADAQRETTLAQQAAAKIRNAPQR